ncbi:VSP [Giardia lamblia P15]|uniref:VSP n=1 Tax=Giardia intestinalis (strain P15) TaxID=658858 RepID=E1F8K1_GIAIA|nr:VSP [Giardia lamblia P15]
MLLVVFYFVLNAFAAPCDPDGNHLTTCAHEKCEKVNAFEVCTECKAGGVPIDGFCRPIGSPQVITAGCTKGDGTALEGTATTCGKCGSGYFLFTGSCYKTGSSPSDEICTTAEGGTCTVCNTANGLFKNPAAAPDAGRECLFCWDTAEINGITGVVGCSECSHIGTSGPVTCSACQDGYFLDKAKNTCTQCTSPCRTCTATGSAACTSCIVGNYLKGNQCVEEAHCTNAEYPDKKSGECKACNIIAGCTTCAYDDKLNGPKCSNCGSKIIKTEVDGTTTCVEAAGCAANGVAGSHFLTADNQKCFLCSDATTDASTLGNKGIANCKTCTKTESGSNPTCSACLDGYFFEGDSCTKKCADNCATCSAETAEDKCLTCKAGFFLVEATKPAGRCIPCDSTQNGGISGCAECTGTAGSLKCTQCKPDYAPIELGCQRSCEDVTGCGGTAGACDATVVDGSGITKHYCSFCGESSKFPIDGVCVSDTKSNTCGNHICTACTTGYFLYMGGCYDVSKAPGNYMCKIVGKEGICTEAASDKYFVVPGATSTEQSVLACANPLGTLAGGNAYVGVDGCSTCTAPAGRNDGGMAVATCTACGEGKKPNKSGNGCVLCSVKDCKSCKADEKCEECSSGFSLENDKCVSTGASGGNRSGLSTGAIAGIAVAAVIIVGGLVGFLCWWFICRGKA